MKRLAVPWVCWQNIVPLLCRRRTPFSTSAGLSLPIPFPTVSLSLTLHSYLSLLRVDGSHPLPRPRCPPLPPALAPTPPSPPVPASNPPSASSSVPTPVPQTAYASLSMGSHRRRRLHCWDFNIKNFQNSLICFDK